jgi:arylsulfatase A-like enzyme
VERLASEGLVFDNANVVASICTPSRYSFLTGRYASRSQGPSFLAEFPSGVMSRVENNVELEPPSTASNLASSLQKTGYRTGFVGKSHIIRHDLLKSVSNWSSEGLDTYPENANPHDDTVSKKLAHNHAVWCKWMKNYGFDFVDGFYSGNVAELSLKAAYNHNLEWTVGKAINFLEGNRTSGKPFFLYFASTLPHGPLPFIKRKGNKFLNGLDADARVTPEGIVSDAPPPFMPSRAEIRAASSKAGLAPEREYIAWMDASIGAIMKKLEDIGMRENTILILASDHGSWRHGKSTLYEGGIRIPFVVSWPAQVRGGARTSALISSVDLVPTLLTLAGAGKEATEGLDGRSFLNVLKSPTAPHRDNMFSELGWARSVKTTKWKYIAIRYPEDVREKIRKGAKFPGGKELGPQKYPFYLANSGLGSKAAQSNSNYYQPDQLYDLENDPTESRNLFEKRPEIAKEMQGLLSAYLKGLPGRPFGEFTR